MKRIYTCGGGNFKTVDKITGNFATSASDAAQNFLTIHAPDYIFISCNFVKMQETEKHGLHSLYKCECYKGKTGKIFYVRESSC